MNPSKKSHPNKQQQLPTLQELQELQQRQELQELQKTARHHQHLYYIKHQPTISDYDYDQLLHKISELENSLPQFAEETAAKLSLQIASDLTSDAKKFQHQTPILSLKNSYNIAEVIQWLNRWQATASQKTDSTTNPKKNNAIPKTDPTPPKKNDSNEKTPNILIQWKIDGATLVLYYKAGKLVHAVTRGTGIVGEEITENAKQIDGVPHQLNEAVDLIARGEVYMNFQDFLEINEQAQMIYLNPRNLAAGSLKQKNPLEVKKRRLRWMAFDCQFTNAKAGDANAKAGDANAKVNRAIFVNKIPDRRVHEIYDHKLLEKAKALGLPILEYQISSSQSSSQSHSEIEKIILEFEKKKPTLPYPCDGLVLKVDHLPTRQALGSTSHSPRWAIAYKFLPETAQTEVTDIDIHVGRTGRVTPRASLKPVAIAGSIVQYATLHNDDFIRSLKLRVGSTVEISKRGDIIPAIEKVLDIGQGAPYEFPKHCPGCNEQLARKKITASKNKAKTKTKTKSESENESKSESKKTKKNETEHLVGWFCTNETCPERMIRQIIFFANRNQMDIEGLGEASIRSLHRLKFLQNLPDIYRLHQHQTALEKLPGFAAQSISKLILSIEKSKQCSYSSFLVALGLPELGPAVVQCLLAAGYNSTQKISQLMISQTASEDLQKINGIGKKTAQSLPRQFRCPKIQQLLFELHDLGLPKQQATPFLSTAESSASSALSTAESSALSAAPQTKPLDNQSWCISGSFDAFSSRKKIAEILESMGARVVSSISKRTTHLLTGKKPSRSKLDKSKEFSIKNVSEQEFLKTSSQWAGSHSGQFRLD